MDPFVAGAVGTGVGLFAKTAYNFLSTQLQKEIQYSAMVKYYPMTRSPVVPDILKHAVGWKTENSERWIGYAVGADNEKYASDESILFIQDYLNERAESRDILVPSNAVAVSQVFKTTFAVGDSCHEFVPKTFESEPDAYFTYQMMGPTVQATYYNVDGTAYLAGLTYYLTPKAKKLASLKCERILVINVLGSGLKWPPCDRMTDPLYTDHCMYGRYCKTAKKHVLVYVKEDKVHHAVLIPCWERGVLDFCKECTEEHKNYKFVPKSWKKKVEEPVKEDSPAAKEVETTAPIEEKVKEKDEEKIEVSLSVKEGDETTPIEEKVDKDLDEYEFLEKETLDAMTIN